MIDIPTPKADAKTETGLAERLVETAKTGVSSGAFVRASTSGTLGFGHWEADQVPCGGRTVA